MKECRVGKPDSSGMPQYPFFLAFFGMLAIKSSIAYVGDMVKIQTFLSTPSQSCRTLAAIVMTRQLIILGLLIFSATVYGQTKGRIKNPPPPSPYDKNSECSKKHKFSPKYRLKNYPFDSAESVIIVSFNYSTVESYIYGIRDTTIIYGNGNLPIKADTLSYADLTETFLLSEKQIDSLTDILYNYDFIGEINSETTSNCYDPHNAIVFLDKHGRMFEFIEICFLCDQLKTSSPKIKTGNFCYGKYDLLRKYFRQVGLTIGVESK